MRRLPLPARRHAVPDWAGAAPPLAGLPPGHTVETVAALLETGRRPDGTSPRPPMPPYRLSPADARAVAAYLASLSAP